MKANPINYDFLMCTTAYEIATKYPEMAKGIYGLKSNSLSIVSCVAMPVDAASEKDDQNRVED
jgi:hypothetical protein